MIGIRGFAIAVLLVIASVLMGCSNESVELDLGTCFDDPDEFDLVDYSNVPVVDCGTPHDNEVFAIDSLPGDEFPGREIVAERANEVCFAEFEGYVGESYENSIYVFSWFVPSNDAWDSGDREVICFAYDQDFAKLTGSIKGIAQ